MAGRIDYSISVTPIQTNSAFEGVVQEAVDAEIGKTLGGGNSSKQWDANAIDDWADGTHVHKEAYSTPVAIGADGDDMIFIKHTGKRFDSSTTDKLKADGTADTTTVVVYAAVTPTLFNAGAGANADTATSNIAIAKLEAGESMIIPEAQLGILVGSAASTGSAPAVEYAKLT